VAGAVIAWFDRNVVNDTVRSRHDQITALTVARTTTGVKKVIDDLRLETPAVSAR
jgi:hypothetical protein